MAASDLTYSRYSGCSYYIYNKRNVNDESETTFFILASEEMLWHVKEGTVFAVGDP